MKDYLPGHDAEGVWMPRSERLDWDEVFRHYAPAVRAYVRARVPSAVVDDVVQDTFERAYRSRDRYDATRPMWPWLVTIAKRACIEVCRRRVDEVVVDVRADQLVARDDPHREYERRQQAVAISYALAGLTPRHRRLLVGWEIDGRPFDHLAAEEGLSRQALKSVLCRARHGFRSTYASIAERAGLAAFAFGRLLGRARDRLHRASTLPAGTELALGGVVVGMTAATLFAVLPATQSAIAATEQATARRLAPTAPLVVPAPGDTSAGSADATGPRPADPTAEAPAAPRPRLPRTNGGADVKMTPSGPEATLGVQWESDDRWVQISAGVTVDCIGPVWHIACDVIRATPAGR